MTVSLLKVTTSANRLSALIEELDSIVEERDRLVVLKLTPSANDNYEVIGVIEKVKKYLEYLKGDLNEMIQQDVKGISSACAKYESLISSYNEILSRLVQEGIMDVSEYKVEKGLKQLVKRISENNATKKSVRFNDAPEDLTDGRSELMGTRSFKPYRDEDDSGTDAESFDQVSNQQMFAAHQQTLIEQDQDLDTLHGLILRQHSMGSAINIELDEHMIVLDDLEQGVDVSQRRLDRAANRLVEFRRKCKENGSLVTIVVLTVILIMLLVVLN